MQLDRCGAQGAETLEEAYEVWALRGRDSGTDGRAMLELIAQLRACPDERRAWGLTSLAELVLLSSDAPRSPWYVKISAPSHGGYRVEYLMPACSAPWPHAHVRGEAESISDAVGMVITAMDRSGGWTNASRLPSR
jgi:hypothetical protein